MNAPHHTIDALDVLLRGQAVRLFQVQMMLQNPAIAAMQPQSLKIKLGLEAMQAEDIAYFKTTAEQCNSRKSQHGTR